MIVPIYLVIKYADEYTAYLSENVSDPENYDLEWLRRTMIVLSILYFLYVILLLTDRTILYVVIKSVMLVVWFYFFYKALFLKNIRLEHSFKNGWIFLRMNEEEDDDDEEQRGALFKRYA